MADERAREPRRGLLYWSPILALAVLAAGYAAFAGLGQTIQAGAHERGAEAMREFPGDEVEALMALVESERHTLAERNHAVNALGLIGDARALPLLERLYTGEECQHDKFLCQHELRKAIDKCKGKGRAPKWLPFLRGASAWP